MRAYWISSDGKGTALEAREAPRPVPAAGQLLVRVRAAGLNRGEFLAAHGLSARGMARPAGIEAAGEIEEISLEKSRFKIGDRVMGRASGAFAEYALIDEREAIAVPDGMPWEAAGAVPIAFMTVHDMLVAQGALRAGEWLLVTGIASSIGVAALQLGQALGAKVIGTSGAAEKLSLLEKIGLDIPVHTRRPDFHDQVMKATGGKGVNLVVNNVGGTVFAECVRCLAFEGRLATVGYLDGSMRAEIDLDALHAKRLRLFGVSNKLRGPEGRAASAQAFARDVLPLITAGKIKPLIDRVFPFAELPAAKRYMESDAQVGKIVVTLP